MAEHGTVAPDTGVAPATDARLARILEAVLRGAAGETDVGQLPDEEEDEELYAVLLGIQMLLDELGHRQERLQRSITALEQFARVASHDLRAPLRSIGGFVQLLGEEYGDALDPRANEWIGRVLGSVRRMDALVDDLLVYARLRPGERPSEPTRLAEVFECAVEVLGGPIEEAGAEVTRGDLPEVVGCPRQLEQVFQNLIGNAITYRGEATPRVHVWAVENGKNHVVAVRDNGIGIDPEHSERIFEVFERLHTSRAYPGTGVGLAICRQVVENHGGRIWVEPTPGGGSTFSFTLPRRIEAEAGR